MNGSGTGVSIMAEAGRTTQGGAGLRAAIASALALAALIAFAPVLGGGFLPFDDQNFILQNAHLQQGFTGESLATTPMMVASAGIPSPAKRRIRWSGG